MVDNTEIPCLEYIKADCVVVLGLPSTIRTYFGFDEEPLLSEVLETLTISLKDVRDRTTSIENNCC